MKHEIMSLSELLNAHITAPSPELAMIIAGRLLCIYSLLPPDGKQEVSRLDYQVLVSTHPHRIRGDLESYVQ